MDITFESFSKLVYRLGSNRKPEKSQTRPLTPADIFTSWLNHLSKPLPAGSGNHVFRILYPHEGARRRYGLKETKLAYELQRILGVKGLMKWDAAGVDGDGTGCLGKEVERVMRGRAGGSRESKLTLNELDLLLDQLASYSPFSQLDIPPQDPPSQTAILTRLYTASGLSPYSLGLLTQIILHDVRPYLEPLPSIHSHNPTANLRIKSTAGPPQLDLMSAMKCWDPRMWELYRSGKGDLDWCCETVEALQNWDGESPMVLKDCVPEGPVVGVNVQIPKCLKGRSISNALDAFCGTRYGPSAGVIWAETKYDGYRMQIHIDIRGDDDIRITIFSKSKRNASIDRLHTHSIILSVLGLPVHQSLPQHAALAKRLAEVKQRRKVRRSIILEAEVVPYNEGRRQGGRGPGIEEFWCLGLAGVTGTEDDIDVLEQQAKDPNRHLCLAFFDILHLDGANLLQTSYESRRSLLESVIRPIQGFAFLAERRAIDLDFGRSNALEMLQDTFNRSNQARHEGLVLKADQSHYLDPRWRWVKLKKDYIPNLGDCVDLVVLGAGWDMDRARELRVDTSVLTTFYIGVLTNRDRVAARIETPHFEILFKASYGLDRGSLESINGEIRHGRWRSKPYDKDDPRKRRLIGLSWTYHLARGMAPPSILFEQPRCAEVMGAGFLKLPGHELYELRFPRIQKIFDPKERSWSEAVTSQALIGIAHQSLGYIQLSSNPNTSPQNDSMRALWRSTSEVALTDVPELPTPSPERPSARRMMSAPQLPTIKTSPSTRTRTSNSRSRWQDRPVAPSSVRDTSDKLAEALDSLREQRHHDPNLRRELPTPVTSPIRPSGYHKRLAPPLSSPISERPNGGPSHSPRPMKRLRASLHTPPTSSPPKQRIRHGTSQQCPQTGTDVNEPRGALTTLDVNMDPPRQRRIPIRLKPLSLRARIQLAIRTSAQRSGPSDPEPRP